MTQRFLWVLLAVLVSNSFAQDDTFTNPVFDRDFPDPDVVQVDGIYYAYATNTPGYNIQVARSPDLVAWQSFGYAWAPEVTTFNEGATFRMYFTARYLVGYDGIQCIGVATSEAPEGPFRHVGDEPLVCQQERSGSIDASTFVDKDGTSYLLWKNDGNALGGQSWLWIQELSPDGLELLGEPVPLITANHAWEGVLVEAPTLWLHDGRYYLFYSANTYNTPQYAVGYAVADDIPGPYEKPSRQPLLKTSIPGGLVGPGGQDIVVGPDGEMWLLYHAWAPGGYRNLHLTRLVWEDGTPRLQGAHNDPQPIPGGNS
jgi:arabinan endo-1,5-alpha-L-arabinosidase